MRKTRTAEKRSPLRQDPLRSPGESLMEERERLFDDRLLPAVIVAVCFVLYAFAEWWRWAVHARPHPIILSLAAIAAVGFLAVRFREVRPRLRSLRLGLQGEKAVGQFLEANRGPDWHVLHDIPGHGFNVDHVLITPNGIFAIETKTFSKPATGEAKVTYNGERVLVNGIEPHRNPVAQARAARDCIRDVLRNTTGITYPVRGVVLFPGWWVEPAEGRPDVWVLNEKAFVKFVENETVCVKSEDVALAASRIQNHVAQSVASA